MYDVFQQWIPSVMELPTASYTLPTYHMHTWGCTCNSDYEKKVYKLTEEERRINASSVVWVEPLLLI